MRIAIMQPYLFPYVGYFQLIKAVDTFILLDDAAFIKKGWIHRNRLCFNNNVNWFSVPIQDASQNRKICETQICQTEFPHWKKKFLTSLETFYKKQTYFSEGMEIAEKVLSFPCADIATLAETSLNVCCAALGLQRPVSRSSRICPDTDQKREGRLIELCQLCGAQKYLNAIGGMTLYNQGMFAPHGLQLEFLQPMLKPYQVKGRDFVPGLSILDAIMCCGTNHVAEHLLCGYAITEAE